MTGACVDSIFIFFLWQTLKCSLMKFGEGLWFSNGNVLETYHNHCVAVIAMLRETFR